ncbi:hypothetical protein FOG50_02957 [Hanseniaspora uvarum]|nr:hypothetical protein FOG48_01639 [Hanseniaspora uvarum]KAF0276190.1 hypothetical protein FOG50_02957 [Hanseniaspora uvarum]GMM41104.1 Tmh18 protein [Hanseniaspora uvarum]
MSAVFKTTHLLSYSFIFGASTYYSYIVSPKMFKVLDKESFSTIQSAVFRQYFGLQALSGFILPVLAYKSGLKIGKVGYYSAGISIIASLSNLLWLQPLCHNIKKQRQALDLQKPEDAVEDEILRKQFGKYHGLSLLMNVIYSASLLAYGIKFGSLI